MLVKNPNIKSVPEDLFVKVDGDQDEDLKLDLIFHNYNLALNYQVPEEAQVNKRSPSAFESVRKLTGGLPLIYKVDLTKSIFKNIPESKSYRRDTNTIDDGFDFLRALAKPKPRKDIPENLTLEDN